VSLWQRIYRERRALVLPLLVLLAVDGALLGLGVFPLSRIVVGLDADAEAAESGLLRARLRERQANDAQAGKARADQELGKFYVDVLPGNRMAAQRALQSLQDAAAEAAIDLRRIEQDEALVKDSRLARLSGTVALVGDYANIRRFLYNVETAQPFVIVERVGLAQASDTRSGAGRLEVTLDVATYYLVEDAAPR
jgi:Tfp pilus assembly protein PilO